MKSTGTLKVGVVFPHATIEPDAGAIARYVRAVEDLGFSHFLCYDHVIGANRASRPGWKGYDLDSAFYEPMSLLSFIAGITTRIGIATGVLILPQRQTVLVAKQAATLDLLSNGRLRLGVGTGWNDVEYEALGMDFRGRGACFDEQIDVLRRLWTERAVTIETPRHRIVDAGIFPLPVQRPIPLWLGGGGVHPIKGWAHSEPVIRRIARKADGWMPTFAPDADAAAMVERLRDYCREYGRDPASIGIEALLIPRQGLDWAAHARAWQQLGATHLCCNCAVDGISGVAANLRRLEAIREVLTVAGLFESPAPGERP